jgi:pimeloyl-ACP methyl ester carboxylesterase
MKSGMAHVNDLKLAYDSFGRSDDPAVLLIMGNSAPGVVWPDRFCQSLADCGYHVVRYDQRDTGTSSYIDFEKQPYTLRDLVRDAFGLMDEVGIDASHFVGLSQGGNIAYLAGLSMPQRVLSITSIMSSPDLRPKNDAFTGHPARSGELPRPSSDYVSAVIALNKSPTRSQEDAAARFMENFRLAAGPTSPFAEDFWLALGKAVAERSQRDTKVANHSNHSKAQIASAPLTAIDLGALPQPCLILHGEMDPIFPVAHAKWALAHLSDGRLFVVPGMGHALDPAFIDVLVARLESFLATVRSTPEVGCTPGSEKHQALLQRVLNP